VVAIFGVVGLLKLCLQAGFIVETVLQVCHCVVGLCVWSSRKNQCVKEKKRMLATVWVGGGGGGGAPTTS
jgi:hypothetical protein